MSRLTTALRMPLRPTTLIALVALYLAATQNFALWKAVLATLPGALNLQQMMLIGCLAIVLSASLMVLLSLLCIGRLLKPASIAVLLIAALCSYFMDAYGTIIDQAMIVNTLQTDSHEAGDLLTPQFIAHIVGFGLIPAFFVAFARVRQQPRRTGALRRVLLLVGAFAVLASGIAIDYKQLSLWARPNKQVRLYINPSYPIYSAFLVGHGRFGVQQDMPLIGVAMDAVRVPRAEAASKPLLVVVVVGETARAANFSLLGYGRDTNPELAAIPELLRYTQVTSCGTSTAISVPCMFSGLDRDDFSRDKAKAQQNLLDVVKRTGIDVLWRDNNSGCKGVCARVDTEELFRKHDTPLCNAEECLDEILLADLDAAMPANSRDRLIVMHQKGSHGPAYFKRYPPAYRRFTPECAREDVQACSRAQISNSYDNTIVYTDHVLASLIHDLQARSAAVDSVLLYVSDHGESLGESGIYLHGLPYSIAPLEQTHVPMLIWFSDGALASQHVAHDCLSATVGRAVSHDNLFDTVLGLFRIRTERYRPELDLFQSCRVAS
jgi:lipid A ethanolaminephosphotransferase